MSNPRRTILCLINMAAYSRTYFEALEMRLNSRGFDVFFVLDSHFSDIVYSNGSPLPNAQYFTDYCAAYLDSGKPLPNRTDVSWNQLFSDFDRFLTMDIPLPLGKNSPLGYSSIPGLLRTFFEEIFDQIDPVAVLYEQASNSFALAANEEAKRRSIPFLSLAPGRISGRLEVSPTGALRDHATVGRIYREVQQHGAPPEASRIAKEYIENVETQIPDYMKTGGDGEVIARVGLFGKYFNADKLAHFWRSARYSLQNRKDVGLAYMHGNAITISLSLFRRSVRRRLRIGSVTKYYRSRPPHNSYFLYPLHFHPEASTSVLASDFVDELSTIKAIAFRLPAHVILAVKEHPSAVALQPIEFYKQLDALPNVVLIGPNANSKQLAKAGLGVICLTSTLGFEAAALNKPVICLGDVLFGYFPNVRMVENYKQLAIEIKWALSYEPIEAEEILAAMSAYVEYTEAGTFGFRESINDEIALENMADVIARTLKEDGLATKTVPYIAGE